METSETAASARGRGAGGPRTGRPYDRSSDALILSGTLELLAERGYERLTVDEVAARTGKAKTTVYRRWATKEDVVLAAIRAAGRPPESERLPDRGSLRSDLLAVVDSPWLGGPEMRMEIFAGLTSAGRSSETLASVIRAEVTNPYVDVYLRLLTRAVDRGEVAAEFSARIPSLAQVIPAMTSHGLNAGNGRIQRGFFVSVIDDVVLAALHLP